MLYAVLSTDTQKTLKYHLFTVKSSFTVRTIDCVHQTVLKGTKLERLGMSPTCFTITLSMTIFTVPKVGFFSSPYLVQEQWTVLLGYMYLTISPNIRRYEACYWWQFHLSARQCTNAYCIEHSPTATVQNTHFPFFLAKAPHGAELNSNDDEI